MGRYEEHYWSNYAPFDTEEIWGCEITDIETGLVGTTHRWRSSKEKAHNDAWEDLVNKQNELYSQNKDTNSTNLNYSPDQIESKPSIGGGYDNTVNSSGAGSARGSGSSSGDSSGCLGIFALLVIFAITFAIYDNSSCSHTTQVFRNGSWEMVKIDKDEKGNKRITDANGDIISKRKTNPPREALTPIIEEKIIIVHYSQDWIFLRPFDNLNPRAKKFWFDFLDADQPYLVYSGSQPERDAISGEINQDVSDRLLPYISNYNGLFFKRNGAGPAGTLKIKLILR